MAPFVILFVGATKRFLWAILVISLPISVDITLGNTGHISGAAGYVISVYDIVLAFLYLLWMVEMVQKKSIGINFFPGISIPAILLILIAALSMFVAPFPDLSKFELIEMIKMYLGFLYLANNIKNISEVKFIIAFLIFGLFFEGVLGFAQHRYSEPFWPTLLGGPRWIDNRVSGTWVSYNDFSWYLTFILPIAMSMLFSQIKPAYKFMCGLAFILGGGSLMWTNSRGGWISFIAAALFVSMFVFNKIKGKYGLIKTYAAIMAVLIVISPLYPRFSDKFVGRFFGGDRGSAESRLPQNKIAYNIIMDKPFTGIGLNNYTEVVYDYDITQEGLGTITSQAVHNIYLQIAAEIGIFGIAVFLWFIFVIYIEGIRYIFLNEGFMVYAIIGMLAGIVAFLTHGMVDTASLGSKLFLFIWFFAGIIFAIKKIKPVTTLILEQPS